MPRWTQTLTERFRSKVVVAENGCWLWAASKDYKGYGRFKDANGKWARAHRVAYELFVGPIPDGMQIDHVCRDRACVNPAHLDAVTPAENTARGDFAAGKPRKAFCKRGHPRSGENLYMPPKGQPQCRACNRERMRGYRAARKR